jgi:hypothetical protein
LQRTKCAAVEWPAREGQGAADRGEYCQAAGATAQAVTRLAPPELCFREAIPARPSLFWPKIAHISAPFRNNPPRPNAWGASGGVVLLVSIVVLGVMLWADNTTLAALAAILTVYAGLLASQIFPENFPNHPAALD